MRCKLLQKRSAGKTTEFSKNLWHIAIEYFFQNRCIFQLSLKYIKLVIPEILFILVLCNINFYVTPQTVWTPMKIDQNKNFGLFSAKTSLTFLTQSWRRGACHGKWGKNIQLDRKTTRHWTGFSHQTLVEMDDLK